MRRSRGTRCDCIVDLAVAHYCQPCAARASGSSNKQKCERPVTARPPQATRHTSVNDDGTVRSRTKRTRETQGEMDSRQDATGEPGEIRDQRRRRKNARSGRHAPGKSVPMTTALRQAQFRARQRDWERAGLHPLSTRSGITGPKMRAAGLLLASSPASTSSPSSSSSSTSAPLPPRSLRRAVAAALHDVAARAGGDLDHAMAIARAVSEKFQTMVPSASAAAPARAHSSRRRGRPRMHGRYFRLNTLARCQASAGNTRYTRYMRKTRKLRETLISYLLVLQLAERMQARGLSQCLIVSS